jgi:hypothetical protein
MLTVDLGAVSEDLIDSELFGHVKGAFTDARADRVGRIQAADGGTLFLDEIGNLPLRLQPKLLTVLEQRQVTPVGANKPVPVDIRVIAATNLPPEKLRDEAHFRQDLLFRLNTVEIDLPPLRERREDVPELIEHYLDHYARSATAVRSPELSPPRAPRCSPRLAGQCPRAAPCARARGDPGARRAAGGRGFRAGLRKRRASHPRRWWRPRCPTISISNGSSAGWSRKR